MNSSNSTPQFTLAELAAKVDAKLSGDPDVVITGGAPIETAKSGDISFVANKAYLRYIETTRASALVLDPDTACDRLPVLRHKNPYFAFAGIIDLLYPEPRRLEPGIDATALIETGATIDHSAGIGPLCHVNSGTRIGKNCQLISSVYIGRNVTLGDDCLVYPGVRILNDTKIGSRAIIHPGVIIGSDGFGFAESEKGLKKIRQVGWVEIEDDVEIGANTTIDRGALGPTRIGQGTKIDNLVQIAHNVVIGKHCIIVSQVGISGSTRLGDGVVLAGQVGLAGHIMLGDGVMVGAKSGVKGSIPAGKKVFGYPAKDLMESSRIEASLRRLPELLKRVRELEEKLGN